MIDVKLSFTMRAKAAVDESTTPWQSIPLSPQIANMLPNKGDVLTVLPLDPLIFVVVERHYRVEQDRTVVTILLDLAALPSQEETPDA